MRRPHSLFGLALRALRQHPRFAWASLGVALVFALGAGAAIVSHLGEPAGRCRLERGWSGGDPEHHEALMIFGGGTGRWVQHDGDGERRRVAFRWQSREDRIVIATDGERRRLKYRLREGGHGCVLRFDRPPLAGSRYHEFTAR